MPHPLTWPAIAGLAMVGSGVGVWLGESAVSEINPIYFSEPETRFHADLVPYRSPDWARVHAAELRQASQSEDYGRFCLGCIDYPEEVYFARSPEPDGYRDGWSASASYEEPEPYAAAEAAETAPIERADPDWQRVQLYASARVSADEPEQAPAQPPEEPAHEAELEPSGL